MMGRQNAQEKLFYQFRLEDHVPSDHPPLQLDAVVKFDEARTVLAGHYSAKGRPSVDPELMLRMLLIGYAYGIRSERQLCNEVHLNLAYRWFCRLGLEGAVPGHSTFSKNRYGRFRESDVYRMMFEKVVEQCRQAGFVCGEGLAVDGSFEICKRSIPAIRRMRAALNIYLQPITLPQGIRLGFRPRLIRSSAARRQGIGIVSWMGSSEWFQHLAGHYSLILIIGE
jgi:transposase